MHTSHQSGRWNRISRYTLIPILAVLTMATAIGIPTSGGIPATEGSVNAPIKADHSTADAPMLAFPPAAGQYNLFVYYDDPSVAVEGRGTDSVTLPAATGAVGAVSYRLERSPLATGADKPVPAWIKRAGPEPGIITVDPKAENYRQDNGQAINSLSLRLTATDAAGNTATLDFTVGVHHRPTVESVRLNHPADPNGYRPGETVIATVSFHNPTTRNDEAVSVKPGQGEAPYLNLDIDRNVQKAHMLPRNNRDAQHQFRFSYTVAETDQDPDGISIAADALRNGDRIEATNAPSVITVGSIIPNPVANSADHRIPGPTLDFDNDGLIEISTSKQLDLIRHDTDRRGNIDGIPSTDGSDAYFANGGFPNYRGSTYGTGCPNGRCIGYELTANLTLTSDFNPIVRYNAVLEGNGHTITNLKVAGGKGMFGTTYGRSVIRNLGFINPQVSVTERAKPPFRNAGIIAGDNRGDFNNVYVVNGTVRGQANVGMLAGRHQSGAIRNVYVTGTVTGARDTAVVGAIAGFASGAIRDGYSRTNLTAADGTHRGFIIVVGRRTVAIHNVYEEDNAVPANAPRDPFAIRTARELKTGSFPEWDASVWDFGDDCRYPVLKSGGHQPERQTARGNACFP